MRPADIGSLIAGLLVIVGIALAMGQYPRLERFAREQAVLALRGWEPQPFFVKAKDTSDRGRSRKAKSF